MQDKKPRARDAEVVSVQTPIGPVRMVIKANRYRRIACARRATLKEKMIEWAAEWFRDYESARIVTIRNRPKRITKRVREEAEHKLRPLDEPVKRKPRVASLSET
jgi:hypothetical protein